MARPQPLKLSHVGSSPSPGTMNNSDIVYVARYLGKQNEHWVSVCSEEEEAFREAAKFIRDKLGEEEFLTELDSSLTAKMRNAIRFGEVDKLIEMWNEKFPKNNVRVYKSLCL